MLREKRNHMRIEDLTEIQEEPRAAKGLSLNLLAQSSKPDLSKFRSTMIFQTRFFWNGLRDLRPNVQANELNLEVA
jgi:hypothetical protein